MRITVTLDVDVHQLISDALEYERRTLDEVLNDGLRRGLVDGPDDEPTYRVRAQCPSPRGDLAAMNRLADELDNEVRRTFSTP